MVGVEPITIVIRSGRLRWYGHVMRKGDEDWVKKCMEFRVECRRPVGRPKRSWLESVEADITEFEIDKEDVHDRMTTYSKCHQQLGQHNTKHINQSVKHHTTTNIITIYHHGV